MLKDSYGGSRVHLLDNPRKGDSTIISYDFVRGLVTVQPSTVFFMTKFFLLLKNLFMYIS